MGEDVPELLVPDAGSWRAWLDEHGAGSRGVWLVLAKKDVVSPTSLAYDQALDEALCHGWIDGQVGRRDAVTYRQRFTPRRARSPWSARNVDNVARLTAEGRMQPGGVAAVERAQADGRWDAAYPGSAAIEVPEDLAEALSAAPEAQRTFENLTRTNRYAVLYRVQTAKRPETRARRIAELVLSLARGETPYPQKR
jgi:uncharacterized protein YdeI (YjbR/CyaY-like superfamily)